ncbi:hypothetical protein Phi10:1_gp033 [Cellulophaga phage phi10:1]|uniref:Uncharacterized protein n=1 Tax=Cellulophaga phage phi10:1 TaxID=1327981 RepID=R9ZYG4_9CAUD|nr:hypothetical protein Phi10:1_gp033 [Cellulophaga phage phi10:1]AGO48374.1 hypothetical protein Phi10:1_gp033 [Cellulophaga phage phi10:1]
MIMCIVCSETEYGVYLVLPMVRFINTLNQIKKQMLVDLTPIKEEQERRRDIAKEHNFEYLPQDDKSLKQETGIYQCSFAFNFSEDEFAELQKLSWDDRYKIFPNFEKQTCGVADNIEQIKEYYKEEVSDKTKKYAICVTPVWQDEQSEKGGWRWHKWGEYIGKLNPKCEYLYDEDFGEDFEYVLTFTLYAIK